MSVSVSPQKRKEILDALRRGTVPQYGLDALAVGLGKFEAALSEDLERVATGAAVFKSIRGDYGCGKTFLARWLQDRALKRGFAVTEVQISETETPLHRLETVYRRLMERLRTSDAAQGGFRSIIDAWFFALEEDVLAAGTGADESSLLAKTDELVEQRLASVSRTTPMFALALRAYRKAMAGQQRAIADGILAWLSGQPSVGAEAKRAAGVRGDVDHFAALGFLQGLLALLKDSGFPGLLVVLDEVETLQRMRGDVREKALNALRQLIDEIDAGRFPGLYLVITGTPAFFDGPQGIQRLQPLAQRLHVDFTTDARFDNARAVQLRLQPFSFESLVEVGKRVRDLYAQGAKDPESLVQRADDSLLGSLATGVAGKLGGKVGVAPRIYLRKLVGDLLDRIDQHADFDPRRDYTLTLSATEMNATEQSASGVASVDDIELKL
ncbi:MAG: BREX system ATP-binding protein BrxD [Limisphaerales bacterium]